MLTLLIIAALAIIPTIFIVYILSTKTKDSAVTNNCLAGNYIDDNGACIICPTGSYCPGDSKKYECTGAGTVSLKEGNIRCTCIPGNLYNSDTKSCVECASEFLCRGDNICPDAQNYNTIDNKCDCIDGYYRNDNGDCVICREGYYCPNKTEMILCPTGLFTYNKGMTACVCDTGYRMSSTGVCTQCINGTVCRNGMAICPSNSSFVEGTDKCVCITGAHKVVTGDNFSCELCPPGFACANEGITACNIGYAASLYSPICDTCNIGYYKDNNFCTLCSQNYRCPGGNDKISCAGSINNFNEMTGSIFNTDLNNEKCYCPSGYYKNTTTNNCIICSQGNYCPGNDTSNVCPRDKLSSTGASRCICSPGKLLNDNNGCIICPTNKICDGTENATTCPTGTYPNANQSECYCNTGTYKSINGLCIMCPSGSACPGDNNIYSCPINTINNSTGSSICTCSSGYYKSSNFPEFNCSGCPSGNYACPGDNNSYLCPERSIANSTKTFCKCDDGYYMNGNYSACNKCGKDYYCFNNIRTACPQYSSTINAEGATGYNQCICENGKYMTLDNNNTPYCAICPSGSVCISNRIIPCQGGSVPNSTRTSCGCAPGSYSDYIGHCTGCPTGFYCSGGSEKISCDPSNTIPLSNLAECRCQDGLYMNSNTKSCEICPVNSYCANNTSTPCPLNATSLLGSSAYTGCVCPDGSSISLDNNLNPTCITCNPTDNCYDNQSHQCPRGSISLGSTGCSVCTEAGYYKNTTTNTCDKCLSNHKCPGNNVIQQCPDTTQNISDNDRSNCYCPDGKLLNSSGNGCISCPVGYICQNNIFIQCMNNKIPNATQTMCICPNGYTMGNNGNCILCPANRYCVDGNSSQCPTDRYSNIGSTGCTCNPSLFLNSSSQCENCSVGSYCPGDNTKQQCVTPLYSTIGQSGCNSCIPGYKFNNGSCSPCSERYYCMSGIENACIYPYTSRSTGQSGCFDCVAGYYKSGNECIMCESGYKCPGNNDKILCGPGTTSSANRDSCACTLPGYYNSLNGCEQCPIGQYCTGNYSARICPTGSTTNRTGMSGCECIPGYYRYNGSCISCPAGQYCRGEGYGPVACTDGYTTSGAAQSSCNACLSGYYKTTLSNGTITCTPCEMNNKCPDGVVSTSCNFPLRTLSTQSISCNSCAPGFYINGNESCAECETGRYCIGGTSPPQTCTDPNPVANTGLTSSQDCVCPGSKIYVNSICYNDLSSFLNDARNQITKKYGLYANHYAGIAEVIGFTDNMVSDYNYKNSNRLWDSADYIAHKSSVSQLKTSFNELNIEGKQGFYFNLLYIKTAFHQDSKNGPAIPNASQTQYIKFIFLIRDGQVVNNEFNLDYIIDECPNGKNVYSESLTDLFQNNKPLGSRASLQQGLYNGNRVPSDIRNANAIGVGYGKLLNNTAVTYKLRITSNAPRNNFKYYNNCVPPYPNTLVTPTNTGFVNGSKRIDSMVFVLGGCELDKISSLGIVASNDRWFYAYPTPCANEIVRIFKEEIFGPLPAYSALVVVTKNEYKNLDLYPRY